MRFWRPPAIVKVLFRQSPISRIPTFLWTPRNFSLFCSAEVGDFGVADGGDVAAGDEELHDLGA